MNAVQRALEEGKLFFDGATGTYASAIGGFPEGPVEMACLTAPQRVAQLHRAYLRAGCTAIKTNTFAAHIGLAAKDEAQHRAIIRAALRIAREQAGNAFVFADIGPAPDERSYMHTADVFLQEGADCFLFETLPSLDGVLQTARMIRQKRADAFIAVSIASNPDGYTRTGEHAGTLLSQAACCEAVDAVGLNCVCGAYHMKKLMERFAGGIKKTLMAMPNAGYPHVENGRTYYESDPEYYARQTAQCAALGVKIFGGCCGTTPEHMLALREALRRQIRYETGAGTKEEMPVKPCRSLLRQRLQEGKRIVLVELDPPAKPDVRWSMCMIFRIMKNFLLLFC